MKPALKVLIPALIISFAVNPAFAQQSAITGKKNKAIAEANAENAKLKAQLENYGQIYQLNADKNALAADTTRLGQNNRALTATADSLGNVNKNLIEKNKDLEGKLKALQEEAKQAPTEDNAKDTADKKLPESFSDRRVYPEVVNLVFSKNFKYNFVDFEKNQEWPDKSKAINAYLLNISISKVIKEFCKNYAKVYPNSVLALFSISDLEKWGDNTVLSILYEPSVLPYGLNKDRLTGSDRFVYIQSIEAAVPSSEAISFWSFPQSNEAKVKLGEISLEGRYITVDLFNKEQTIRYQITDNFDIE
jgi:hypothetical protein